MMTLVRWIQNHRKLATALAIAFFIVMACCAFPIYNLTKQYSKAFTLLSLLLNISVYYYLGTAMAFFLPKASKGQMVLVSLLLIGAGMLCRWLLEYGEVSNMYNFTPANIALHLLVTMVLSTLSWYWARRHPK